MSMASLQHINEATLEDIITCPICTLRLQEPKHLQCQHAFCTKCLTEWLRSPANTSTLGLPCPTCRHITRLPRDGVPGLPADFNKNVLLEMVSLSETTSMLDDVCATCRLSGRLEASVSFCTDCEEYLCGTCLGDHNSEPALKSHNIVYSQEDTPVVYNYICAVHKRKKLSFFCPKCLVLACNVCIRTLHRGHGAQYIEEAVNDKKNAIADVLLMIDEKVSECSGCVEDVEKEKARLRQMFHDIKRQIKAHARHAQEAVEAWQEKALNNLKTRQHAVEANMSAREKYLSTLANLRAFYEGRLHDMEPRALLVEFDELMSRGRPLLEHSAESFSVPSWRFVPMAWPDRLGFLETEGDTGSVGSGGGGKSPSSTLVRPRKSVGSPLAKRELKLNPEEQQNGHLNGEGGGGGDAVKQNGVLNGEVTQACGAAGEAVQEEVQEEAHERQGEEEEDTLAAVVARPRVSHVYGAMAIKERVTLKNLVTWGAESPIDHADDVILVAENWLLVCQRERRVVQRFWVDNCEKAPEVILEGFQPGRMAVSRDGSIAVTDPKHGIVHMLAAKGSTISARPKWTPVQMVQPWAVAFSYDTQNVILSDMHTKCIVVYDENLRHKLTFGGDSFESPTYVCCDKFGRILVSDGKRNLIQAFNISGDALWSIQHWGSEGGSGSSSSCIPFSRLRGITTDSEGRLLATSGDGILMFGADGRFICQFVDRHQTQTWGCKGISWIQTSSDNVLIALSEWNETNGGTVSIFKF